MPDKKKRGRPPKKIQPLSTEVPALSAEARAKANADALKKKGYDDWLESINKAKSEKQSLEAQLQAEKEAMLAAQEEIKARETPPITSPPTEESKVESHQVIRQPLNKYTILASIAAGVAVFGFALMILWVSLFSRNNLIGIVSIMLLIGGIFAAKHFWEKRQDSGVLILGTQKIPKRQVNSMNLYPDKGIVFEDTTDIKGGQPWRCHNDGKMYFVNKWNAKTNRLEPFILPDQQYRDPEVFAQKVLELPAHRRIFRRKETLLQQLSPAMMLLAIIVFWIVMITTLE